MANKKTLALLRIGNIVFFLAAVTVNVLANAIRIGGKSTGELSDAIPNLFVPAGLTFAIWGVIYLLLLIFILYQARGLVRTDERGTNAVEGIGVIFIVSCIANAAWIFTWHYALVGLALIIMLVLLACLIGIYLGLRIGKERVSLTEKLCVHLPFSVYLGWITVATIANVTALLVTLGWDGFGLGEIFWTVLMIIVAALIALLSLVLRRDIAYSLVIAWAILGIYLKRSSPAVTPAPEVAYTALICLCVVLAGGVITAVRLLVKRKAQ
jgi:hypothetical protein